MSTQISYKQNNQQRLSNRRRRILMKQKCNYIDHQISLNLSKLDQLLCMIQQKKQQQQHLPSIKQSSQGQQNQQVKKQRKLKFKYSIHRQYEFQEQDQQNFCDKSQVKQNINIDQTKQTQIFESFDVNQNQNQEEMLLNDCNLPLQNDEDRGDRFLNKDEITRNISSLKLSKNKSIKNSQFSQISSPQTIKIQTRYNWIDKYLDHSLHDTVIKGVEKLGNQLQVLKFNIRKNIFQCQMTKPLGKESTILANNSKFENYQSFGLVKKNSYFKNTTNQDQFQNQSIKKQSKRSTTEQQQYLQIPVNEFININPQVSIQFSRHTQQTKIISSSMKQVTRLTIAPENSQIRIILKNYNLNQQKMQRIMIFKQMTIKNNSKRRSSRQNQNEQQIQEQEKYKIVWARYQKDSFVQDIVLEGGFSYLIVNMCNHPESQLSLLFNPLDLEYVKIQKAQYEPWRSYNMLCSSFQQCSRVFMSQNTFDDSKPLEFLRANFLNYGLVLQIYQNIYNQKVTFIENSQNGDKKLQDKQLLFEQIYSDLQSRQIYQPQQLVIKFYQVTQKPARLYFPTKSVLINNQIVEHVTIHSTFK